MGLEVFTRAEEESPGHGQDRMSVRRLCGTLSLRMADGAGGLPGGGEAARLLCESDVIPGEADAAEIICTADLRDHPGRWLSFMDGHISLISRMQGRAPGSPPGLTAAAILTITDDGEITGASVGDCEAWIFGAGKAPVGLTSGQSRKPLLGEGAASPVEFRGCLSHGVLIMATDGLWKHVSRGQIARLAHSLSPDLLAGALVDSARLPTGRLQDDITIMVVVRS